MIPTFFNGMITILLARFMLNDVPHAAGILDSKRLRSGNPFAPIGVWFESPKIEAKVKSVPGLLEHIGSSLTELGQKHGARPKTIGFAEIDSLAMLAWGDVTFNAVLADLWLMDEGRTKQLLKHVIPHEFGHYMMAVEHVKIPLPKGPKWKEARKDWGENYADEFAERESGMTKAQVSTLTEELHAEWERKVQPGVID